jgi:hypothetical protein
MEAVYRARETERPDAVFNPFARWRASVASESRRDELSDENAWSFTPAPSVRPVRPDSRSTARTRS